MRFVRTLSVGAQADALAAHRRLAETGIADLARQAEERAAHFVDTHSLTPDDPDWQIT